MASKCLTDKSFTSPSVILGLDKSCANLRKLKGKFRKVLRGKL